MTHVLPLHSARRRAMQEACCAAAVGGGQVGNSFRSPKAVFLQMICPSGQGQVGQVEGASLQSASWQCG
eukprot:11168732-Lingulodinium_polyedra.AAC.1